MSTPAKRSRGGQPKPEGERLSATIPVVRVLPEHRAEWERLGGPEWLRAELARAVKRRQRAESSA